ncbi:hypothetical protein FHW36_106442 [Chitinophaga polysaccharea]|uniref:Uncharacterized protein n=1 Tax=Chitinophaga polysaccharea TaxID=1293035 RepID=A0A561PM80_9BACT|nr:hypothetical protein FHW36_106442 [Chitinophaga polysaccharea]
MKTVVFVTYLMIASIGCNGQEKTKKIIIAKVIQP